MRLLLIAVLVSGCATNDDGSAEGAHLVAHVTAPSDFDQVFVSYNGNLQVTLPIDPPKTTYDWDHWEVFSPLDEVSITVALGGNAVATGEASNITYVAQDDGTLLANILLPLGP
jgi:hypothetical protein